MYSMGFNSFWSFGSPAVQELLTKSNLTLDELLDEDGLILEVKNHNQNLYEFLLREKNFKELISCAISIPDVESLENNRKKIYKYPFTCADILSSDSQPIVNEFFKTRKDIQENTRKTEIITDEDDEVNVEGEPTEKDTTATEGSTLEEEKENTGDANECCYLDHLFSFLDSETLNLTSAGYFAKIVNNLLNKRPSELISYIYEKRPELLHKMIQHIYSKSIAEFLAKVLTFESSILANVNNEVYNDKRSEVLKEIIKKLEPESDIEEINNTAYLICEVFGKYNTMHCSHEILHNLLEQSIINYFFEILKSGKSTSACAVALILGNIFAYYILVNSPKVQDNSMDENEGYSQSNNAPQVLELTEEIPLVASFVENIDQIIKFIGSSSGENIPSQHGANNPPFGSARLKVLELIIIAMKANNKKIYAKLIEHDFLETLFAVFVKHNWNNMLHSQVEKILSHIIDGNSEEIKTALFEKAKILDFIVEASKDTEQSLGGKHARKVRKGYMGHLIRLSNKIIEHKDPVIHNSVETNENWKTYVEGPLNEANQRDKINIGGRDPRAPVETEDVRFELPSYMQKFTKHLNKNDSSNDQNRNQDNDDDDDDDEEEKREEEDVDVEEVEDLGDDDDNKHQKYESPLTTSEEFISETEKHVIHGNSAEAQDEEQVHQATVPVRGRHSFDPVNRFIPDYDEEVKEEIESHYVLDAAALKTVEENLDSRYYNNVYFKREEIFSADDVLKEFEGL